RLGDLKAAHDAEPRAPVRGHPRDVPPLEGDAAAVHRQRAGYTIDQRRLARAVRADEPEPLAGLHRDAHLVERQESPEALGETVDLEERAGHRQRVRSRRTRPRMPSGARTTNATSTTPSINRLS